MSSLLTLVSVYGLLDVALKSMAVVLLAVVVVALLGRASAACRHLVWCLSVAGLLLLPVLSLLLPDWRVAWLPRWSAQPTQLAATEHIELAQVERTQPLEYTAPLAGAAIVLPPSAAASTTVPPQEPHHLPPNTIETSSSPRTMVPWLAIAWSAGGLPSLVPLAIGLWQLARLHRRSQVMADRRWLALLQEIRRQLALRRHVQLRQSESSLAPLTWGALRPVLLVPFEAGAWPDKRRRLVLLHELAHVRRWDWLTQLVAHVACAVYWFNPLVWWAARQMRIERELACDDIVLASGARASDYARELLALAAGLSHSRASMLAALPMARRVALDDRLHGILDSRRNRTALSRAAVCLGAALAAAAIAPLAMLRAAPPEATESETTAREPRTGNSRAAAAAPPESNESESSETAEPKKEPTARPVKTLEMTVNTCRILTIGKRVPRVQINNPEAAEITAVSPTQIRVMAKKPGRTQVNLFDEDEQVYTVDTIVYSDAREFRLRRSRQQTAELKKKPAAAPTEALEMTVSTSRILTIGKPVLHAQVNNKELAEITALSPIQIQVVAKKPGTTQVNLFDEEENVYTIDIIVYSDAREFKLSLQRQSPKDLGAVRRQVNDVDDDQVPPAPAALANPEEKDVWNVTLEEAIRSTLENSKTLRNQGGVLFTPAVSASNHTASQGRKGAARDKKSSGGAKVKFVLARTRDDLALADFEAGVRAMLSDVERAYWDLYYNYRNLEAVRAGRDSALATWRKVYALYITGSKGGEAEKERQSREQYFLFRAQVENTLGMLYTAESRLRYMMGVSPADGRLIRPADEPTTEKVHFDLTEILSGALNRDVELSDLTDDQELELAHMLINSIRDLDRNYQVNRTTFNRRVTAQAQVETVQSAYDAGTATVDMLLDAERRSADAQIAYYRALVDYNVAILQVHYRKNSLLEHNGILLAEGIGAGIDGRKKR